MNSTSDPKAADPADVLVARPDEPKATDPADDLVARADERLVHAYNQIARADEQLARLNDQLSSWSTIPRPTSAVVGLRPPRGRPALRGVIGLLLAAFIFVGAFVSQSSYGNEAKLIVARWAPQLISTSSPMEKPQPSPSTVQLAAATPELPQPAPAAQTVAQDVAPQPPRYLPSWRSCSRRWRAISQTWSKESSSSR